jgi:predicted nucleic acid-binding Zn ribbon protein
MIILCEYCGESFKPTRRFVQKYCCDSCRVLDYRKRKKEQEIQMLISSAMDKMKLQPGKQ